MNSIYSKCVAGLCLVVVLAANRCLAQFGRNPDHVGNVVVTGNVGGFQGIVDSLLHVEVLRRVNSKYEGEPLNQARLTRHTTLPSGSSVYSLALFSHDYAGDPSKLWEQVRAELEKSLQQAQLEDRRRFEARFREEYDFVDNELALAEQKLQSVVDDFVEYQVKAATGSQIQEEIVAARTRSRELRLENVGLEARRLALEQQIERLRQETEKRAEQPILDELRKAVELRQRTVRELEALNETQGVTQLQVRQAEADLVEAKIQLYRAQREAQAQSSGQWLRNLNNELSKAIVQLAELKAQSDAAQSQLAELSEQLARQIRGGIKSKRLQQEVDRWQKRVAKLEERRAALRDQQNRPHETITLQPLIHPPEPTGQEAPPTEPDETPPTGRARSAPDSPATSSPPTEDAKRTGPPPSNDAPSPRS